MRAAATPSLWLCTGEQRWFRSIALQACARLKAAGSARDKSEAYRGRVMTHQRLAQSLLESDAEDSLWEEPRERSWRASRVRIRADALP
jgi:hypothetical protein